jgi:hypothetical protein
MKKDLLRKFTIKMSQFWKIYHENMEQLPFHGNI